MGNAAVLSSVLNSSKIKQVQKMPDQKVNQLSKNHLGSL